MEQRRSKNYFQLNRGLNTERNEITFEDGFSTDESDYELLVDGSRRRRKGLDTESGGANLTYQQSHILTGGEHAGAYVWKNVGGDDTKRFIAHHIGQHIYFTDDDETPSNSWRTDFIDLATYGGVSVEGAHVHFSQGKGELFIANRHLVNPLRVTYDSSSDLINVEEIQIQIRDFTDDEDDILINESPPEVSGDSIADLAADYPEHYYNLINRGWKESDLGDYAVAKSAWPAKNWKWFLGYRRQTDVNFSDLDGIQTFSPDKIEDEAFAQATAPKGSLLIRLSNDTVGFREGLKEEGSSSLITGSATVARSGSNFVVTVNHTGHGFTPTTDTVTLETGQIRYLDASLNFRHINLAGTIQTVATAPTANTWTFNVPLPGDWDAGETMTQDVTYYTSPDYVRSVGTGPATVGPQAVEFHSGRLFYAGIPDPTWSDYIFYSQVAEEPEDYKRCHMEADPTDPNINQGVATDGGYIALPGIGNVIKLKSHRGNLYVFSDQGVWEISTGRGGIFTPDNFQVRKVTDDECDSPYSPVSVDDSLIYTGPKGIIGLSPSQFTGNLEPQNLSDERIRTLWNNIAPSFRKRVQTVYDDALKRVIFLHGGSGNKGGATGNSSNATRHKQTMLILDLRVNAWYKWWFESNTTNGILYAFAISGADTSDSKKKLKVVAQTAAGTLRTCDFDQSDYADFYNSGSESSTPYMFTGWDNIGDHQRRRQAPVVTVYAKRTTTGYTSTGNGFDADNPSSNKMTAYWDWTDDAVTGKIYGPIQTYRDVRPFVPSGPSDVDGVPVVVTRNKVRGRGRALQLKFEGEAGFDSHLLGFTINYKVTRKI